MECFTGGHAALAVFAVLTLGLCIVLLVIVAAITMEKVKVLNMYMYVIPVTYIHSCIGNWSIYLHIHTYHRKFQ